MLDFIKEQELLILQNVNNLKYTCPDSVELMRKLIVEKTMNFADWTDISSFEFPSDAGSLIKALLEEDILINRRRNEFKFKNTLTRNIVMSKFKDDKETKNGVKLQSDSSSVRVETHQLPKV